LAEDIEILKKVASGDRQAFNELFTKYHRYLVSIAYKYTQDIDISRDLSQEVFLDVWKRRTKIDISISFKSFIRRAVINQSISKNRGKKHFSEIDDANLSIPSSDNSAQQVEFSELQEKINEIVSGLPDRCKQIFELSRFENKSHKQIAAELNISTKTIENQMTKALKALRNGLKKSGLMSLIHLFYILNGG